MQWNKKSNVVARLPNNHTHTHTLAHTDTHYYSKVVAWFESADYKGLFRVEQRSAVELKCSPAVWLSSVIGIRWAPLNEREVQRGRTVSSMSFVILILSSDSCIGRSSPLLMQIHDCILEEYSFFPPFILSPFLMDNSLESWSHLLVHRVHYKICIHIHKMPI